MTTRNDELRDEVLDVIEAAASELPTSDYAELLSTLIEDLENKLMEVESRK